MSYFAFKSNKEGEVSTVDRKSRELLVILAEQIKLLNARVEEGFETGIEERDVEGDIE